MCVCVCWLQVSQQQASEHACKELVRRTEHVSNTNSVRLISAECSRGDKFARRGRGRASQPASQRALTVSERTDGPADRLTTDHTDQRRRRRPSFTVCPVDESTRCQHARTHARHFTASRPVSSCRTPPPFQRFHHLANIHYVLASSIRQTARGGSSTSTLGRGQ